MNYHIHSGAQKKHGPVFLVTIILNTIFTIVEIFYGFQSNSLALISDAIHNAGDVAILILSWASILLARRKPTTKYTYGLQGFSIIASTTNAVLMLMISCKILLESFERFSEPQFIRQETVITVAAIGILVNTASAILLMRDLRRDLNMRAIFMNMAVDAIVSLAVLISGFVSLNHGFLWLDPVMGGVIGIAILIGSVIILKSSLDLVLHAVPSSVDYGKVLSFLINYDGVLDVHDLHIWSMSTTDVSLSVHLVVRGEHPGDDFIDELSDKLEKYFQISHVTIQIEIGKCRIQS